MYLYILSDEYACTHKLSIIELDASEIGYN
jgi:hypothetical protein